MKLTKRTLKQMINEVLKETQFSATDFRDDPRLGQVPYDVEKTPSPESGAKTYEIWFGPEWPNQMGAHNPGTKISGLVDTDILERFGNTKEIVLIKDEEVAKRLVDGCGGFGKTINGKWWTGEQLKDLQP